MLYQLRIWMLNLVSNARYYFATETDEDNQSCTYVAECKDIDKRIRKAVPYEGIRKGGQGRTPWFGGDPTVYGWAQTDFSLYSGAHLGILASLLEPTNVDRILRLDLQVTQFLWITATAAEGTSDKGSIRLRFE